MAWVDTGILVTGSGKLSGTTVTPNSSSPSRSVGDVVLVFTAWDNTDTTDVNPTRLSVTDGNGNTYTRVREFVNGQGSAATGAHVGLFYSIVTVAGSGQVTVTCDTAQTAKAAMWRLFTFGAGSTIAIDAASDLANDAADPGSMSSSGLSSTERLYVRATALERATGGTWTVTSTFSTAGSIGTSGGSAVTNMDCDGEYKIATSTGETSDPTATAVDCASIFVALGEVVAAAARVPYSTPYPQLLAH